MSAPRPFSSESAKAEIARPSDRVLLVDDSETVLDGLARLMGRDYDVVCANSADEALAKLEAEGPFAVVVSDHEMPGRSGLDFLDEVRREHPNTQRILMTGHRDLDVALRATNELEVLRFLLKPVVPDALRTALSEGLERHEQVVADRELAAELGATRKIAAQILRDADDVDVADDARAWLRVMSHLANRLTSSESMEDVAAITAASVSELLHGAGVRIELCTDEGRESDERIETAAGAPLADDVYSEAVTTSEGRVGEITVAKDESLDEDARLLLRAVASFAGVAASNQLRRRERDEAQHAVIFALARLAEARDNETGQHLERVSSYCALAAEGLREEERDAATIDDAFVQDIVRSAPLHDIGKVGIPDSILLKPGKLDPEEWQVMQTHAAIGADILSRVIERTRNPGFLLMALDIAWCHHEKWDGSGYPRGLSGEDIPLASRILSVADCFDALTTRRPYKEPWSHDDALDYLERMAGTQFDPLVVAKFLENRDRANEIRVRLADDA